MSGFVDYVRRPLPDRDYDLEPLVLEKPTAHTLNDDVILNIMGYLSFRELVSIERVCRRWQCLVYSSFRIRTRNDVEGWMIRNKIGKSIQEFIKVLIFGSKFIARITVMPIFMERNSEILRIIGQLCPNLKVIRLLHIRNDGLKAIHFKELGTLCTNLEEFIAYSNNTFRFDVFSVIMSGFPELRILQLDSINVDENCLSNLPKHLKELQLLDCCVVRCADDSGEPFQEDLNVSGVLQCPELEIFILNEITLSASAFNDIGRHCKKLRQLNVIVEGDSGEVDWSLFQNLEDLSCANPNINLEQILIQLTKLEELEISGRFKVNENIFYDFSQLQNLKCLHLSPYRGNLNRTSLQTLYKCENLEEFKFFKLKTNFLLKLIKNCSKLRILEAHLSIIKGTDISDFVNVNKDRGIILNFTVDLYRSAFNQIEKLREANYDIDSFGMIYDVSDDDGIYDFHDDDF